MHLQILRLLVHTIETCGFWGLELSSIGQTRLHPQIQIPNATHVSIHKRRKNCKTVLIYPQFHSQQTTLLAGNIIELSISAVFASLNSKSRNLKDYCKYTYKFISTLVQLYKIIVYIIVLQIQNEFLLAEKSFVRKFSTFLRRTKFCESLNGFTKIINNIHMYSQIFKSTLNIFILSFYHNL